MSHGVVLQLVGLGLFGTMIFVLAFSNQIGSFIRKRQKSVVKDGVEGEWFMRVLSEKDILSGSVIIILISAMVGVIGMMGMYSAFPNISGITEPTCECVKIHHDYNHTRSLFSIIGWFFGLVPVIIWQVYTHLSIRYEEKLNVNNEATGA